MTITLGIRAIVGLAGLLMFGLGSGKVSTAGLVLFGAASAAILITLKF